MTEPIFTADDGFVLRPLDIDVDAKRLAEMWTASDDQWPGTWSGGVAITPEMVRERHERSDPIEVSVWEAPSGEIAGYCSVSRDPEHADVAWIPLLNVPPAFQGRSLARRMLVHYVERVRELGFVRLDLGTWSGNLKSVPTYKKCGFRWFPDTSVYMPNFMPAILSLPLARPFFDAHDWYASQRVELTQEPDDDRFEGVKAFRYRFEAPGATLTVWIDRESKTPTAIETDDVSIAALGDEREPARGFATSVRARVRSAAPRRVEVALAGSDILAAHGTSAVEVDGEAEVSTPVDVAADIEPSRVRDSLPAPTVSATFTIDGVATVLRAGMRPRLPVTATLSPQVAVLAPGVDGHVNLQLRNRTVRTVGATLRLELPDGLHADWTERDVELAPESFDGVPVVLRSERPGGYEIGLVVDASVGAERAVLPPEPLGVFVTDGDPVGGRVSRGVVALATPRLALLMTRTGGRMAGREPSTEQTLFVELGHPLPPEQDSEFFNVQYELDVEAGARPALVGVGRGRRDRDVEVRKRVALRADGVVDVGYEVANLGAGTKALGLREYVQCPDEGQTTLPLGAGFASGPSDEFPGAPDETFKKASSYAEGWGARSVGARTVGLVWSGMDEVSGAFALRADETAVPRGDARAFGRTWIYTGDGGPAAVRSLWAHREGVRLAAPGVLEVEGVLRARFDPAPPIATAEGAPTTLVVENVRSRPVSGRACIRLPDGFTADPAEVAFTDVRYDRPHRTPVRIRASEEAPYACEAVIELRAPDEDRDDRGGVVRTSGAEVSVSRLQREGHEMWTVDAGPVAFDVVPSFGASIVSMRTTGRERLASPFPTPRAMEWVSPWYGGVWPLWMLGQHFPGSLHTASFDAQETGWTDAGGRQWHGVRQRAELTHEESRGITVEVDALALGGTPFVRSILRAVNTTGSVRRADVALIAFFDVGEGPVVEAGGHVLRPSDRLPWIESGHHALVRDAGSDRFVSVASDATVSAALWARSAVSLGVFDSLRVPPRSQAEVGMWVGADAEARWMVKPPDGSGEGARFK